MNTVLSLLISTARNVMHTFQANWIFLLVSILVSALLKLYLQQDQVAAFLRRHQSGGVWIATLTAVGTPLCSCGTMAILLGMMASMMPWAPIVAFMVASPLSSPQELVYSAGLFGWPFALAFFGSSILLGLLGGLVAHLFERRGWLKDQTRTPAARQAIPLTLLGSATPAAKTPPFDPQQIGRQILQDGPRLLLLFFGFAFVGYLLNGLIPSAWIQGLFGSGHVFGVPLAATLGLPFYINTEASLPLVRAMLDSGMSQGAALAFLITGAGTSFGALGGALTIARWRVLGIVLGTLWAGAIFIGMLYDLVLAAI
jgi:hypothetical protein